MEIGKWLIKSFCSFPYNCFSFLFFLFLFSSHFHSSLTSANDINHKLLIAFRVSHSWLYNEAIGMFLHFISEGWGVRSWGHVIKDNSNDPALLLETKDSSCIVRVFARNVILLATGGWSFSLFLQLPVSHSHIWKSAQFFITPNFVALNHCFQGYLVTKGCSSQWTQLCKLWGLLNNMHVYPN